MKTNVGNDDQAGAEDSAAETATQYSSARYSLRVGSSLTELAKASTAADQTHVHVLELISGTVLAEVVKWSDEPMPEDGIPYRFATIAQSTAKTTPAPHESTSDEATDRAADEDTPAPIDTDPWSPTYGSPLATKTSEPCAPSEPAPHAAEDSNATTPTQLDDKTEEGSDCTADGTSLDDLPVFPHYSRTITFFEWSRENVAPEDVAEAATILGTSVARALRQLTTAMTIIHGLPRFAERARRGEFTMAHIDAVASLCVDAQLRFLPDLDEYLANCRSAVTSDSLRRALRKVLQLLDPQNDCSQIASERRFVDLTNHRDGTASIRLWGPALEINASYERARAMAKAVRADQVNTFNLPPEYTITEERDLQTLMSDIFLRPQPKLTIKVSRIDPQTGLLITESRPLLDNEGTPLFDPTDTSTEGLMTAVGLNGSTASQTAGGAAFGLGSQTAENIDCSVSVEMPTHQQWLRSQAGVVATVPFLSLVGQADLPGILPDGAPIPVELARQIAGNSPSLTRILTDPATGTPLDAKATSYTIPKDLRRTLIAQWPTCTVPGCTRRAVNSEIDHVVPFFHLEPLKGGLTEFGNLHPLCKRHHALKTARKYTVRMPKSGLLEYEFRHGVTTRAFAPDQPINVAQALRFYELLGCRPQRWRVPKHKIPPPPTILELMPGESALRERAAARRVAEKKAARRRAARRNFNRNRAARRRRMLEQSLDWDGARLQKELPSGLNPVTMKRLGPGEDKGHWRKADGYITRNFPNQLVNGHYWVNQPAPPQNPQRIQWEHDLESDPPPF